MLSLLVSILLTQSTASQVLGQNDVQPFPVTEAKPGIVPRLLPWPSNLPAAFKLPNGTCLPKPLDGVVASRLVACEELSTLSQTVYDAGYDLQRQQFESDMRREKEHALVERSNLFTRWQVLTYCGGALVLGALVGAGVAGVVAATR